MAAAAAARAKASRSFVPGAQFLRIKPLARFISWVFGLLVVTICAIVDELDRTFVPEIEATAGPAPEWFDPGR
jgi:hypothetical protein